jgi:hypothetical protein
VNIYSTTQAFSAGVTYSINHGLGTNNILINIWNDATGDLINLGTKRTSINTVDLYSTQNFSSVKIVIIGG